MATKMRVENENKKHEKYANFENDVSNVSFVCVMQIKYLFFLSENSRSFFVLSLGFEALSLNKPFKKIL